jgi:ribosomal protein S21
MKIIRRDGEGFDEFFARYRRSLANSGILKDAKRHRFFISPSESRRLKRAAAERRRRKRSRRQ